MDGRRNLHVGSSMWPLVKGSERVRPIGRVQIRSCRDGVLSIGRRVAALAPRQRVFLEVVVPEKTRCSGGRYQNCTEVKTFWYKTQEGTTVNLMRRIMESRSVTAFWSLLKIWARGLRSRVNHEPYFSTSWLQPLSLNIFTKYLHTRTDQHQLPIAGLRRFSDLQNKRLKLVAICKFWNCLLNCWSSRFWPLPALLYLMISKFLHEMWPWLPCDRERGGLLCARLAWLRLTVLQKRIRATKSRKN